jgi:electron transfer flavoprotein beta subunit
LEQALSLKEKYPDTTITLLTMGPGRAAEIIRESMYRGADRGFLLTDRAFAGSDTLATSYALACAIKTIGAFDLIICGRQAIDGDTAQVGPQVAEKLSIPQITYAEEIFSAEKGKVKVKRRLERGVEIAEGMLPLLITVNGSAPECRPRNAKLLMKYKRASSISERQNNAEDYIALYNERPYLNIPELNLKDIHAVENEVGLAGSPTKVKKIENVVFQVKESKVISSSDVDIESLMLELITNHTIG